MPRSRSIMAIAICLVASALVLVWQRPAAGVAIASLNLLLVAGLSALRLWAALASKRRMKEAIIAPVRAHRAPFVSIHLPIHDEPPEVVQRTLAALARLDYPADRHEIIVLDNNTRDPATWRPVLRRCQELGARFRFRHVEGLEGAKAGALTLCRGMCAPESELVLVVDADYLVDPQILSLALAHLAEDPSISHVQFPQAYFNIGRGAAGASADYAHYFETYLPCADAAGATLLTGTLSLIRLEALDDAGGWSARSITEDAELGTRLLLAGYRGRYAPVVAGRGMMPSELGALRKQRRRWSHGNAQALSSLGIDGLRRLGSRRALAVLAQLTAWFELWLVPAALLLWVGLVTPEGPWAEIVAALCLASLLLPAAVRLAARALVPRHVAAEGGPGAALVSHQGLAFEHGTAWLGPLLGVRLGFVRTSKLGGVGRLRDALIPLLASALFAAGAAWLFVAGEIVAAVACLFVAISLGTVISLNRALRSLPTPRPASQLPKAATVGLLIHEERQ